VGQQQLPSFCIHHLHQPALVFQHLVLSGKKRVQSERWRRETRRGREEREEVRRKEEGGRSGGMRLCIPCVGV
jgi:hypothetical protein